MKTHRIKLHIQFCDAVLNGSKLFEIRYNDRDYKLGDMIEFIPFDGSTAVIHPIKDTKWTITYVLSGWGLMDGYVALGIRQVE